MTVYLISCSFKLFLVGREGYKNMLFSRQTRRSSQGQIRIPVTWRWHRWWMLRFSFKLEMRFPPPLLAGFLSLYEGLFQIAPLTLSMEEGMCKECRQHNPFPMIQDKKIVSLCASLIIPLLLFSFFFFFFFWWEEESHPRHVEISSPGIQPVPQQQSKPLQWQHWFHTPPVQWEISPILLIALRARQEGSGSKSVVT